MRCGQSSLVAFHDHAQEFVLDKPLGVAKAALLRFMTMLRSLLSTNHEVWPKQLSCIS